jgi:hypothetical protein
MQGQPEPEMGHPEVEDAAEKTKQEMGEAAARPPASTGEAEAAGTPTALGESAAAAAAAAAGGQPGGMEAARSCLVTVRKSDIVELKSLRAPPIKVGGRGLHLMCRECGCINLLTT